MKNILSIAVIVILASSCGNPHVSSSRGGLEQTNPPIVSPQEEGCAEIRSMVGPRFYFGTHDEASKDILPGSLATIVRCNPGQQDDFRNLPEGTVTDVRGPNTDITHQTEIPAPHEKVIYLEDFFGYATYPFTAKPQLIDSLNVSDSSKDAFIWSFSSPVKYWAAKVVSLSSNATIRIFNCDRQLIEESRLNYSQNERGANENHFIGFISPEKDVCYVSVSAADGATSVKVSEYRVGF